MKHVARTTSADVTAFEESNNPAGGIVDSNPYGVLAEPGRTYVIDAGGNSLVEVAANGRISLVATFPSTPAREAASTSSPRTTSRSARGSSRSRR